MNETLSRFRQLLVAHGLLQDFQEEQNAILGRIPLVMSGLFAPIALQVVSDWFVCYVVLPLRAGDRAAVLTRFFSYANYRILRGSFEIDENDGEMRYKIAVPLAYLTGLLNRHNDEEAVALVTLAGMMVSRFLRTITDIHNGSDIPNAFSRAANLTFEQIRGRG